jgi:hypothetical protein
MLMHLQNQRLNVVLPRENLQLRPRQRRQKCWRSEVTPGLLAGAEPEAHQFYVMIVYRWGDRIEANSKRYHSNSKLGQACIGE